MTLKAWEDMIARNDRGDPDFTVAPAAKDCGDLHSISAPWKDDLCKHLDQALIEGALERDLFPIPSKEDRENYWGDNHLGFWLSGLRDYSLLLQCCARLGRKVSTYLDFGCASGRVIRHFAVNSPEIEVCGCDINVRHIEWAARYLPGSIKLFQNHSIPSLPLPDDSFDLISAFSVFTHIESFETTWLMELRRILRPGGLAWVTVHSEKTWEEMAETWPIFQLLKKGHRDFDAGVPRAPLSGDRVVFRGAGDASYSSQVFYRVDHIRRMWGRIFQIAEIHRRLSGYQDVVVLRKPG